MKETRIVTKPPIKNTNEELLKQVHFLDGPYTPKTPMFVKVVVAMAMFGAGCLILAALLNRDWISLVMYTIIIVPGTLSLISLWRTWKRQSQFQFQLSEVLNAKHSYRK